MLWLPPKVWLHGSQSTITGRSAARNGHTWRIICWLADSIRCVFSTPFGAPVDPEVNRIFATVSGSGSVVFRAGGVAMRLARRSALGLVPVLVPVLVMSLVSASVLTASSAAANRFASSAKTAPGWMRAAIARIVAWSRLCRL